MQDHEILAASRLRWHKTPTAYRAESGAYIALIAAHREPGAPVQTYRALLAYHAPEQVLRTESFNNLEDAVAWCEWKMPATFYQQEAHEALDAIDGGNIWDFLRSLGVRL
jgi:hypothetical protein